ncbi:MAG: hypothetical protein IIB45_01000 [Candidatus Marinimicrobia bacterium]|nr:hypothetical protein [Candidatus Neomarinimicrobiota bacterium]
MMAKRFKISVFTILLLLGAEGLFANYAFYRTVTNTCKSYRITTQEGEMYFGREENNKDKFYLSVNSNRNNFEMALIVGFVSVGQAIKHQRYLVKKGLIKTSTEPKTIHVTVNVPITRDNIIISASATAEQVIKLTDGKIDSAEFMRLIKNSIVTL